MSTHETNNNSGKIPDLKLNIVDKSAPSTVKNLFNGFKPPVHVAVLCPPGAAVTALLNTMGDHNGVFVLMSQIPIQVGALSKSNGQQNIQLFPLMVFAISKAEFESWMKVTYDPVAMYNMDDIMQGRVLPR